jgi:hypothetical protein
MSRAWWYRLAFAAVAFFGVGLVWGNAPYSGTLMIVLGSMAFICSFAK